MRCSHPCLSSATPYWETHKHRVATPLQSCLFICKNKMFVCGRCRQNMRGGAEGARAAGFRLFDGVIPPEEPDQTLVQSWDSTVAGTGATSWRAKFRLKSWILCQCGIKTLLTFILSNLSITAVNRFNPTMTDREPGVAVYLRSHVHTRFELRHFKLKQAILTSVKHLLTAETHYEC